MKRHVYCNRFHRGCQGAGDRYHLTRKRFHGRLTRVRDLTRHMAMQPYHDENEFYLHLRGVYIREEK